MGEPQNEDRIEELWREQAGIDPETGEAWLTPRMEREAAALEEAWKMQVVP